MKRGQTGFGAVEGLLVIIIVLLVGFIGYYVYHTKNNANSNYSNAASSSNNSSASKSSSTPQLFYFKELGVYITLNGPPLKGNLDYSTSEVDGTQYLDLFTPATQEALNKCAPGTTSGTFMSIAKMSGQFNQNDNPGVANLKQFKDFWISGQGPNGIICGDSASQQDKDTWVNTSHAADQAVVDAFKTATQ